MHYGRNKFNLKEMGITLSDLKISSEFSLIPVQKTGNLVFTSGHDCNKNGELIYKGRLGNELTVDQGYGAAYQCMVNILGSLQNAIGD